MIIITEMTTGRVCGEEAGGESRYVSGAQYGALPRIEARLETVAESEIARHTAASVGIERLIACRVGLRRLRS